MTQPLSIPTSSPSVSSADSAGPPLAVPVTLLQPLKRHTIRCHPAKLLRSFRAAFRAFPIFTASPNLCHRLHIPCRHGSGNANHISGAKRLTGTLFGRRRARITLAIQENPRSVPLLLLELAVPTAKFMTDMGSAGLVRVALECEKTAADEGGAHDDDKKKKRGKRRRLLEEPAWAAFVNGKSVGTGMRREATEEDLWVMQTLHAVSMGAGVLPEEEGMAEEGEVTYMRAHLERVVGSKDSETFYMLNPDGNTGPELSIFFVRI